MERSARRHDSDERLNYRSVAVASELVLHVVSHATAFPRTPGRGPALFTQAFVKELVDVGEHTWLKDWEGMKDFHQKKALLAKIMWCTTISSRNAAVTCKLGQN